MTKAEQLQEQIDALVKRIEHLEQHIAEREHIKCDTCHKMVRGY